MGARGDEQTVHRGHAHSALETSRVEAERTLPAHLTLAEAALQTAIAHPFGRRPRIALDEARCLKAGFSVDGTHARHELGIEYTPPDRYLSRVARSYVRTGRVARAR